MLAQSTECQRSSGSLEHAFAWNAIHACMYLARNALESATIRCLSVAIVGLCSPNM